MPLAVGAAFGHGPSGMDAAVEVDDVVVAYAAEPALAVPLVDVGNGEGLAFGRRAAMDDDFRDGPHGGVFFNVFAEALKRRNLSKIRFENLRKSMLLSRCYD